MQYLILSIHSLTLVTRSLIFSIHQELQLNILQQSQLLQAGETAKTSGQLHQLQSKQQQLVAQLQVGLVIVVVVVVVGRLANEHTNLDQQCFSLPSTRSPWPCLPPSRTMTGRRTG